MAENTRQTSRRGYLILILLLLLAGGLAGLFFYQKRQAELAQMQTERELREVDSLRQQVSARLDSLRQEYEKLLGINKQLDSLILRKTDTIAMLQDRIAYLVRDRARLRKELKKVQELVSQYQADLDSLRQVIARLEAEKQQLQAELQQERQRREALEEEKSQAQILRAGNVKGYGLRPRGGEEVQTFNSSKAQKLEICFDVLSHPIVQAGTYTAYVRLVGPDQKLFYDKSKGSGVFRDKDHNAELQYTVKKDFSYQGKDVSLCVQWEKPEDLRKFLPGTYQVEIYVNGHFAGKGDFTLRKGLFVK